MSNWPAPTRADHDKFCQLEGWRVVRDSRGRKVSHHATYELDLPDGRILRTRVSHPLDRSNYGPDIWGHILTTQLSVSESEFWTCVQDGTLPDRGEVITPPEALPAEMVYLLIHRVGLSENTISALSKEEAVQRLNEYWTTGP